MPASDPTVVRRRLEEFRRNLLDTSLRNRLIDFRTRTKAGKPLERVVEIRGEDPVELVRLLAAEGKAMSFVGKPDPKPAKEGQFDFEGYEDEAAMARFRADAEHEMDAYLHLKAPLIDATDLKLNSDDFATALTRKLTKLYRDARVAIEEQGVNVLFLALGSLRWFERGSEEPRHAPLIMLPVNLERTAAGAFRLRWDGTDPGANLSLAAKLRAEFGIHLPDIPDELDVAAYFRDVERAVESQGDWTVDRSTVALAFFSYAKFLMYRDLDVAGWPEDDRPEAHETLGSLLDRGFNDAEDEIDEEAFLDALRPVAEAREVYDADGSQTLAILEANTGRTMLIEGPPGTGKSQTITNLIAEAIGRGKKVLFVAEKAAALDVVSRRLREANLEDACLELHSHKTNKRGFYAELKRTVDVAAPKAARAEADLKRLEEDRGRLNAYAEALNAPLEPYGIAPRDAMGRLLQMGPESSNAGRHEFAAMAAWDGEAFRERLNAVRRLQAQVAAMGRPADHPFYGSQLDHLLPQDRDDLARRLEEAARTLDALEASANALATALAVGAPKRPGDVDRLRAYAAFVAQAPDVTGVSIRDDWTGLAMPLRAALAEGRRLDELKGILRPISLEEDPTPLRDLLRLRSVTDAWADRSAESLAPALGALDGAAQAAFGLIDTAQSLAKSLGVAEPKRLAEIPSLIALARRLGGAPDIAGMAVAAPEWKDSRDAIDEATEAITRRRDVRARFGTFLTPNAWTAQVEDEQRILQAYGGSFFRIFRGEFRRAMASSLAHFALPLGPLERADALRGVMTGQEADKALDRVRSRMAVLFGDRWQGVDSDLPLLREAAAWIEEAHAGGTVPQSALQALERGVTPSAMREAADDLQARQTVVLQAFAPVRAESNLDDETILAYLLDTIRPALPKLPPGGLANALATLDRVEEARTLRERVRVVDGRALGPVWQGETTDWNRAQNVLEWTIGLHRSVAAGELPAGLVDFFAEERPRAGLDNPTHRAQDDRGAAQRAARAVVAQLRFKGDPLTEEPFADQRVDLRTWTERLDELSTFIRYNGLVAEARRLGLEPSIALADVWPEAGSRLADEFERSWLAGVVRVAFETRPEIRAFDRQTHEETIRDFAALDDLALRVNRTRVALAHWQSVPRSKAGGAMGWLGVQFGLSRSHKSIRSAMERAGEAIQAIKPVFLMSPLSVAMFLPAEGPRFDLVVFDEASQVKPEDAFGGILRAKQTIVVGDSRQMPPTSFFDKLTQEEADEEEFHDDGGLKELESILAMTSAKLPARTSRRRDLRWHYRSRHDALIATSNRLFYGERLVVFPSPERSGGDEGLILRHDPATVYGRGGTRKNPLEARAVALAALRHVREHPGLTLGIAAFSKPQQEAIQDEIDLLRRTEPAFAEFDAAHPFEPLFVKNLENVQGDERDVIFISVGYGRDEKGTVPMSFGPLNREGGERRLNVLITRARVRCEVFTNLKAEDVRVAERSPQGVLALRSFLAFAETGWLDVPAARETEPPSPFDEAVRTRLQEAGFAVESQVGSQGFSVDLAVRHPEEPGRFVLGIEGDGDMYHRARTARDRDKLRDRVLTARGWRLHHVWSADWFQNPDREFARLVEAIGTAETGVVEPAILSARPSEYVELERDEAAPAPAEEAIPAYELSDLKIDLKNEPLHLKPPVRLTGWVVRVVEDEGPVHLDEVVRRIREAAGVAQTGPRIRAALEEAADRAEAEGKVVRRGEFLDEPGRAETRLRSRAGLPAAARRFEIVAPEEIAEALVRVVRPSFGIDAAEAIPLAARLLGFDRATSGIVERCRAILDEAVAHGVLQREDDRLNVPR